MPSSDRPTRTPAASIENATAGDVLQLSGDPDHRPLLITQPFNWWRFRRRVPGLPDTWFITEEAPAPHCLGARSPTAVVMTFARLSDLKRAWFFFFLSMCVWFIHQRTFPRGKRGRAALQWEGNGRASGTDAVDRGEASWKFRWAGWRARWSGHSWPEPPRRRAGQSGSPLRLHCHCNIF